MNDYFVYLDVSQRCLSRRDELNYNYRTKKNELDDWKYEKIHKICIEYENTYKEYLDKSQQIQDEFIEIREKVCNGAKSIENKLSRIGVAKFRDEYDKNQTLTKLCKLSEQEETAQIIYDLWELTESEMSKQHERDYDVVFKLKYHVLM